MLVLTPQLRVASDNEVLKLMPEDAVSPVGEWYEFEEPPLPERIAEPAEASNQTAAPAQAEPEPTTQQATPQAGPVQPRATTTTEFMNLSAKIAALETAIAKTVDQWEPDELGTDPYSGTQPPTMTWEENVELDGTGNPVARAETPAPEHTDHAPEGVDAAETVVETALEEQVIDEETLRAMVAEIVRSELQGELGERITRNVRKLVRREIHRALVAQSLD